MILWRALFNEMHDAKCDNKGFFTLIIKRSEEEYESDWNNTSGSFNAVLNYFATRVYVNHVLGGWIERTQCSGNTYI